MRSGREASHAGINNIIPLAEGNVIGPHSGDFVHKDLGLARIDLQVRRRDPRGPDKETP